MNCFSQSKTVQKILIYTVIVSYTNSVISKAVTNYIYSECTGLAFLYNHWYFFSLKFHTNLCVCVCYLRYIGGESHCDVSGWLSSQLHLHVSAVGGHRGAANRGAEQTGGVSCRITVIWGLQTQFSHSTACPRDVHLVDTHIHNSHMASQKQTPPPAKTLNSVSPVYLAYIVFLMCEIFCNLLIKTVFIGNSKQSSWSRKQNVVSPTMGNGPDLTYLVTNILQRIILVKLWKVV